VGRPEDTHIARRLVSLEPRLAASPSYLQERGSPEGPEDLIHHSCLRFLSERPQTVWELVGPDGEHRAFPVGGQLESDNSMALADALEAGLGIGLCPEVLLAKPNPKLEPVLPGWRFSAFPLYALVPAGRNRVHRVRAFVDWLAKFSGSLARRAPRATESQPTSTG